MTQILVIDDDMHIRKLYVEVLASEGYSVCAVADFEDAYNKLKTDHVDLVILDIELRNENGLRILKRLKTEYPIIPVILNSAFSIYKSDFGSWLADAYVLKSSDMQPLKDKIRELIGILCKTKK